MASTISALKGEDKDRIGVWMPPEWRRMPTQRRRRCIVRHRRKVVGSIPTRSFSVCGLQMFSPVSARVPPGVSGLHAESKDLRLIGQHLQLAWSSSSTCRTSSDGRWMDVSHDNPPRVVNQAKELGGEIHLTFPSRNSLWWRCRRVNFWVSGSSHAPWLRTRSPCEAGDASEQRQHIDRGFFFPALSMCVRARRVCLCVGTQRRSPTMSTHNTWLNSCTPCCLERQESVQIAVSQNVFLVFFSLPPKHENAFSTLVCGSHRPG